MKQWILLLVLAGLLFAQQDLLEDTRERLEPGREWAEEGTPPPATSEFSVADVGQCSDPWQTTFAVGQLRNVFLIIVIVSMALGILYMVGQFLQSPKILATVKDEFFQLLQMSTIVMSLYLLTQGADMWYAFNTQGIDLGDPVAQRLYDSSPTIIDASMAYSRLMIFKITSDLSTLAIFNSVIHTLYTSTLWVGINFRTMWTFNLGPALKPIIDILGTTMQFLGVAIGEWMLHLIMLCLIKTWRWGLLFPLSMILYMIPHTRSAGSALFAIVFALEMLYPMMFVANYEIYRLTSLTLLDNEYLVGQFFETSGLQGLSLLTVVLTFMMAGVLMPFFAGASITLMFELIRNAIYYFVIISLLLPFINIFVTLTFAREAAKAFGANVNFMAFLRLI